MFILLVLEDPLSSNDVMILTGRPLHKRPHLIPRETSELILHSNEPIRILKSLFDPKWFNTRHKREVSAKVHKLSTSNYTLPQNREDFVNLNSSCHQGHGGRWSFKRFNPFLFILPHLVHHQGRNHQQVHHLLQSECGHGYFL